MKRLFGAGLALVTLAGCASGGEGPGPMAGGPHGGPPPGMGGPFGAGGPHGGAPALFISPCGRPFRSAPGGPDPVGMWFSAADADHDGRLSKAEFRADADLFFQVLDRDHDGVVAGVEVTSTSSASPRKSSRAPAMRPPTPTC